MGIEAMVRRGGRDSGGGLGLICGVVFRLCRKLLGWRGCRWSGWYRRRWCRTLKLLDEVMGIKRREAWRWW
jgi:hypothetical protein